VNARTLAALALSASLGAFAFAPAHARDAMAASSSTAMSHDAMHKDGMTMKKDDAMKKGAGDAMSGG